MTEPGPPRPSRPPRPGGVHRRRGNRLPALIISLIGIVVAAGLVAFALHERGEPVHEQTSGETTHLALTPGATRTAAPAGVAPTTAANTTTTASSPPRAVTPSPTVSASAHPAAPRSASAPALDVLNDSRISGLAHRAAKRFVAAGWAVSTIGNFQGDPDVPATTIFYPDGEKAAADRLAAAFGVTRVLAAPSGLSSVHVTIVLARDWPDSTG